MVHDKETILVVDDTPANLDMLHAQLSERGYHVRVASSGAKALASVHMEAPDLILLDIRMPGMDGYEVCRHLKADVDSKQIPVIFLSAAKEPEDKIQAFAVGGVDYITKPFQQEEVLVRIKTQLNLKKLKDDLESQVRERTRELEEEIAFRKKTEKAMQKNKALLSASQHLAKVGGWQFDVQSGNSFWSEELYRIHEIACNPEIDHAKVSLNCFQPKDRQIILEAFKNACEKGEPYDLEFPFTTHKGKHLWVRSVVQPIFEGGKVVRLIGNLMDITERKQLEQQFFQSQKMESIGRLAGGVAHDFNNMLSIIMGSAEMAMEDHSRDAPIGIYLDAIIEAAKRSSSIIRQLLAFSRKEVIAPKPFNLNKLILDSEKNLGRLIGEDIKLSFLPGTGLWAILIDPSQLDQIMMNLAVNARDAMPNGGNLIIETKNVQIKDDYNRYHMDAKPGDYVRLTIGDTGVGMDQVTKEHIFEPFFTTKEVGKGTGLGLAMVYGIVTQNNGFVSVYSAPGRGTVFNLHFPRLLETETKKKDPAPVDLHGSGTILVVEDERPMLEITSTMLESMGYTVINCDTPAEAIAVCEQRDIGIDLILSDVVMPGMNGKKMVEQIKNIQPETKVLFMSGYTADIVAQHGVLEDGLYFVQKPLLMKQLGLKIKEVMGS